MNRTAAIAAVIGALVGAGVGAVVATKLGQRDPRIDQLTPRVDKLAERLQWAVEEELKSGARHGAAIQGLKNDISQLKTQLGKPGWWCITAKTMNGAGACFRTESGCRGLAELGKETDNTRTCVSRRIAFCNRTRRDGTCVGDLAVCQKVLLAGQRDHESVLGSHDADCFGVE